MKTDRTLSRPTLTVQNMTVDSALKPTLPLVDTPRCDSRPTPGTALQPTKRRERFSCTFGQVLLTPDGALLNQLYHRVQSVHMETCLCGDIQSS